MTFSDLDLKMMLDEGRMEVTPLEDDQIGPASIDLTLSDWWSVFRSEYTGNTVDLKETGFREAHRSFHADQIELPSGAMCLGKTLEKISIPADIIGRLEGRSRYARMGLTVHITSAIIQPGSSNHQVLEIVNMAPFPVRIHAGMRISQAVFNKLSSPTSMPYSRFGEIAKNQ